MKGYYVNFVLNSITSRAVFDWCKANLQDYDWKFMSKIAVFGAPSVIRSNRPTYKHPRRGDERVHDGLVFNKKEDLLAFMLVFNVIYETIEI